MKKVLIAQERGDLKSPRMARKWWLFTFLIYFNQSCSKNRKNKIKKMVDSGHHTIFNLRSFLGSLLMYLRNSSVSCLCFLWLMRGKFTVFYLLLLELFVSVSALSRLLRVEIVFDLALRWRYSGSYLKSMHWTPSLETKLVLPLNFSRKFLLILLTESVDFDLNRLSIV